MSEVLTTGQTLKVLADLRDTMRRITSAERVLGEERDRELEAIRRKYGLLKARQHRDEAAATARLAEAHEASREAWEARQERRQAWIHRAHEAAQTALKDAVEGLRSQQKYESQKELLAANREHEAATKSAEKTANAFLSELEADAERFEGLKGQVWDALRGYGWLRRSYLQNRSGSVNRSEQDEYAVRRELAALLEECQGRVGAGWRWSLAAVFARVRLIWWLMGVAALGAIAIWVPPVASQLPLERPALFTLVGAVAGVVSGAYLLGYLLVRGPASNVIERMWRLHELFDWCRECVVLSQQGDVAQTKARLQEIEEGLESAWKLTAEEAAARQKRGEEKLRRQLERVQLAYDRHVALGRQTFDRGGNQRGVEGADGGLDGQSPVEREQQSLEAEVMERFEGGMDALLKDWNETVPRCLAQLRESQRAGETAFLPWSAAQWADWAPPANLVAQGRYGDLAVNVRQLVDPLPEDARFSLGEDTDLKVPMAVRMPIGESLVFESEGTIPDSVAAAMNRLLLRMLTSSPVARLQLTLIDPVGLGKNFAGLMHLADYDEQLVNRRIWTQSTQIEQCLRDLTEHMEKVTQMYLRNEYETLAQYNEAAGTIAERYHLLVVSDFPAGFTETGLRRLQSIVTSGPRCGVFVILHRDSRQVLPDQSALDDLQGHSNWWVCSENRMLIAGSPWPGVRLEWDESPADDVAIDLIHRVGRANVDANRVEVPFASIAPGEDETWTASTEEEVSVAVGRTGASKLQRLVLGKGTQQHVLIAGKTGSGKSTLFHVMITNLALWCRPDQVEFYLVDFKKGVEFKCYAKHRLPHARVVAIESDREFGLSVLERVDDEMRRRGELYRQHGVQDLAAYHRATPDHSLPRTLLMIDEFQEFFVEDDRVSQNAAVLLDRIVRQGRAFGIHVILGSQTLGGAYTLARTTFAQMVVRIALQCDEADSYLIMDESNDAPRLLSRPGEGIYNDSGGAVQGNSPFQTVWLSDEERDEWLERIQSRARDDEWWGEAPVVFEGNAPAEVGDNVALARCLKEAPQERPSPSRAWLGAPNAIKGPTEAVFEPQNGNHLLCIGQNDELAVSMMLCALVGLAAQHPVGTTRFVIVEALPDHGAQRAHLDRVIAMLPHEVLTLRDQDLSGLMNAAWNGKSETADHATGAPLTFLVIIGLQAFKGLRPEDEFSFSASDDESVANPVGILDEIIREGAAQGVHVLACVDSYNNAQRYLTRKAMAEFEMRVLFQMSANDSAALIDGTQASQLGMYRALLYNERKGTVETFRPYALPSAAWFAEAESHLQQRQSAVAVTT